MVKRDDLLFGLHKTDVVGAEVHRRTHRAIQRHLQKVFKAPKAKKNSRSSKGTK